MNKITDPHSPEMGPGARARPPPARQPLRQTWPGGEKFPLALALPLPQAASLGWRGTLPGQHGAGRTSENFILLRR